MEEVFDKLRSQTRSLAHIVKRDVILCFILVFRISSVVCNGGLVVAVRKLSKRWYRNFFSVSNCAAGRWMVGVLEAVPILPVDARSIDGAEVTI